MPCVVMTQAVLKAGCDAWKSASQGTEASDSFQRGLLHGKAAVLRAVFTPLFNRDVLDSPHCMPGRNASCSRAETPPSMPQALLLPGSLSTSFRRTPAASLRMVGSANLSDNDRRWETYQHAPSAAAARLSVDQLLQHLHSFLAPSKGSIGHCSPLQRLSISAACLNLLAQLCNLLLQISFLLITKPPLLDMDKGVFL